VLAFINSHDLPRLAPLGTSCPDHFLRTKIKPLVLSLAITEDLSDSAAIREIIKPAFEQYRADYAEYYEACKRDDSPAMRDANPVVIIYPGIGMFTFAKDKQTARVASEFYQNAINVMRGAEAISSYTALPRQEAFNIEYWLLEEAKLQRMPAEKPLSRRIALITGGGGGIGGAIAKKLAAEGAHIVITDLSEERLKEGIQFYNKDVARYFSADITQENDLLKLIDFTCLQFGGVDIIVHSAGLAISKSLTDTLESDWDILQNVLVKAQFQLFKLGVNLMKKQQFGGNLVTIASKNGLVSGPNNVAYGTAKAAQQHMTRLLAAELAKENIRVNTVNPDGVIVGSKIWEGEWAEGRAKAYGISVSDLPEHYAKRNLLNQIILPEDIANGVFALLAVLNKSTGLTINVDGGIPEAFVR
jgi:rhamnulose-1-phosphate aldolase/alcohol dehydrogenase